MLENFAKDFIALQAEIETLPKDKSGYGYKYTDLDTIITFIKPLCKKHNIGFMQLLETNDSGKNGIETMILHTSGESISAFIEIPEIQVGKANNAQNIGAAISYFKRYALAAAFGISSDEDVDCSDQVIERNARASNQTAPTVKEASSIKSSTKTPQNNSKKTQPAPQPAPAPQQAPAKKYTVEQAKALGEIMKAKDASGADVFSQEERDHYRALLMDGQYEKAAAAAKAVLASRAAQAKKAALTITAAFDGQDMSPVSEEPDALF